MFEDPESLIREGGWLKLVKGTERIPDDYGVAFVLAHKHVIVCAPMPWHTAYGWAYRAYWHWRIGSGLADDALQRAFEAGMQAQRDLFERRIADLKAQHARDVTIAEQRGHAAAMAVVEHLIDTTFPHLRDGRPN